MATFSVDITDVVFAGTRTGHKDITITGMPAGGVTVSLTGSNPTYFTYTNNPESKGTNVYRVSTKSTNAASGGSDRTANLKITNTSDSTDYVTVSLKQYCTPASVVGSVKYVISNYSDIYGYSFSNSAFIYFPYSLSDSTAKVELYVDGPISSVTVPSWASYVNETTYTDTGFSRLLISCTNNHNEPRKGFIKFSTSFRGEIYQNGYPSSTSGCTQSISFTKSGGTESIVLNTSSSSTSLGNQYLSDFTSPTVNKIDNNNYSVTIGTNNTGSDLTGMVWFADAGNSYIGHTIVTQSAESASLTISPTGASVGSAAGTTSVTVTSTGIDTVEYSIEEGWVSLKTQSSNVYTFSYTANTTSSRRSCIVTFYGGGLSKSFVINQAAGAISVSPTSSNVGSTSGTVQVTVTGSSNITYTISSYWITYQSKSGNVYTFAYTQNSTSSQRTATVTFSASGMTNGVFTLTQEGASTDELTATPSSLNFTSSGGEKSILLTYTGTLHLRDDNPDWITDISYSVGSSPKTYYITAAANTSSYAREWKAYFYDANSSIYVPIIQNGTTTPSLKISPTSGNVDENSGRISITVTATGINSSDINYQISGSWLSYSSRSGYTFYFEYPKNTSSSSRTATITFSAFGKTATYTLVQSAVVLPDVPGSFKVYPKKLRYYGEGGGIRVSFTNRPEGGIGYEIIYTDGSEWLSVTDSGPDKYVTATENSGIRRRASIKFYDVNDSKNYVIVPVIQGNIDGYDSIWMDELYYPENRNESGNYYYRVVDKKTNAELFTGISTIPPGWSGNIGGIDIPRLVDGHIHSLMFIGSSSDWSDMYESYITVDIYNMTGSAYPGVVDATFKYCNDWSRFEKRYDYTRSLNDPINGKGCDNMIIPFCVYYDDEATFSIVDTEKNGNINTYTLSTPSTPFAMRTDRFYDTKKLEYKQDDEVIFSYDMDHCGLGAFIYRNRFGGWDSFLIEGNIIKTDNYTKLNYRTKGEYNQMFDFETSKYIDEKHTDNVSINTTYEAYTGWLSDEEAERLVFHLLSSPKVFFQDLNKENQLYNTDDIYANIPIRITASSAEYKKFRNGKKMVNYLITFEKGNIEKVRN